MISQRTAQRFCGCPEGIYRPIKDSDLEVNVTYDAGERKVCIVDVLRNIGNGEFEAVVSYIFQWENRQWVEASDEIKKIHLDSCFLEG